ncbi:ras-associating and dilute domain-containing protein-like isoform X2 [Myxocyprinus asiaticus]|uniref:ras-associating and dilute domain-containing protein-like isoform X2 n=1 Tax=Myxocyprinus asiaticus TaxID=70543 RepID=UPI00222322FE|nr:ras-associating and dilute domain-containing protein-like isoform X2 [Myxocyprinus asiaticus]
MISEERSDFISKQALGFPVGLLIRSPKKRLAKLGRKTSNGSVQSNTSDSTAQSVESTGVRQPAKSKIRRHNNRLTTVFNRSPVLRDIRQGQEGRTLALDFQAADDPAELSSQRSIPGILKIFGSNICQGANYKSVLATTCSSAKELVKEALERYCLEKEDPSAYLLCDVIGRTGLDNEWKTECFRVVGDHEKPLVLQSLWKPKEGFSRRFEIQKRASVEAQSAKDADTVTAGLNAQMRKLQNTRSRVTSLFIAGTGDGVDAVGMWRSLSDMNVSAMGKEASETHNAPLQEDPEAEADKDAHRLSAEKEETESSDDINTQYSIRLPFDFPYFLLLQGYNHRQDFLIYLMSGNRCVFGCSSESTSGKDEETLKVDVLLFAPDILLQHCCVQRLDTTSDQPKDVSKMLTKLRPFHGAPITHNGVPLYDEVELCPGDLVGLGQHYLFMFKDPTDSGAFQTPSWMATLCPPATMAPCKLCGSSMRRTKPLKAAARWRDLDGRVVSLSYQLQHEDQVLEKIFSMVDPVGEEPKFTSAFLLCLCIQQSATNFELVHLRKLLLGIANQVQLTMWERTKELAALQPDISSNVEAESVKLHVLNMKDLISGLQPLVLWMSNSIELLHFIQHEVPLLLTWRQQDTQEQDKEWLDSQIQSTRTASEEAMTVLEEVIMFSFQQCVYYLTKSMYAVLPGLLDSNPFSESGQLCMPAAVSQILDVLKQALQLLNIFQVHSDITSQLLAYLFFFTNASLFNALMEKGSGGGFYQWSRGVQIRANLDLLMDWIQSIGLGDLAAEFFQKLSSAINLLATPKETLLQASWSSLRAEFVHLNPAQLHHMLREYNMGRSCPASWNPSTEDTKASLQTSHILESFDSHPPLILPNSRFHLELGSPITEPGLFMPLQRLQEFIHSITDRQSPSDAQHSQGSCSDLTEETQSISTSTDSPPNCHTPHEASEPISTRDLETNKLQHVSVTPPHFRGSRSKLSSCEAVLTQKLKCLELQNSLPGDTDLGYHKSLALDPSCLLTPPNTPQNLEQAELEASLQEGETTYQHRKVGNGLTGSSGHRKDEDEDEVFTVELKRGPRGLGLALVDGMKTPLRLSGIYVRSVVPDSPAALNQRLRVGDRILAVNGISLVGMDYHSGRELIQTSGDSLRLVVAKTESRSSARSCITRC